MATILFNVMQASLIVGALMIVIGGFTIWVMRIPPRLYRRDRIDKETALVITSILAGVGKLVDFMLSTAAVAFFWSLIGWLVTR
jgi:hypothetical protein